MSYLEPEFESKNLNLSPVENPERNTIALSPNTLFNE